MTLEIRASHVGRWLAGAAAITLAVGLAACGSSSSTPSTSAAASSASSSAASTSATAAGLVISTHHGAAGVYLTGAGGRALYLFVKDPTGRSACSGACATTWPPVPGKTMPTGSGGAVAADFGATTRSDGSKQLTYKGHPLYYYAGDTTAGTATGQGTNSFGAKWWLVSPAGVAITATHVSSGSSSSSSSSAGGGWA
jgi:predicted lipoprotein with Yx(FWY)xxD motif